MDGTAITDADRKRIRKFLENSRYHRNPRDLIPDEGT